MTRPRATLLQPTRSGPFRYRLTLADGSKSPRFDCSPGLTEAKAREQAERMQAIEARTQAIYRAKVEKAAASNTGETVDAWFRRYLPEKKCGEGHRRITGQTWAKWISPSLGREPIASLTKALVEQLRDELDVAIKAGRLSPKSAANVWSVFTSAMKAAASAKNRALRARDGLENILVGVLPPDRGSSAQRPWIYPAEWVRLVECDAVPVEARRTYAIAVYTGLRPNELRALTWGDVDLDIGVVSVSRAWDDETSTTKTPKTAAGVRTVPIHPALRSLLESSAGRASESVVPAFDGRRMAETFREHLRIANVLRSRLHERTDTTEPVDFRSLRDTHATWSVLAGVPIAALQRRLGHRDIATTNAYVKAAEAFDTATIGEAFPPLPTSLLQTGSQTGTKDFPMNMVARVGFEPASSAKARDIWLRDGAATPQKRRGTRATGGRPDRASDRLRLTGHAIESGLYAILDKAEADGAWPMPGGEA